MSKLSLLIIGGMIAVSVGSPAVMAQSENRVDVAEQYDSLADKNAQKPPFQTPKSGNFYYRGRIGNGSIIGMVVNWKLSPAQPNKDTVRIGGYVEYKNPNGGRITSIAIDQKRSFINKQGDLYFAIPLDRDKVFGPVDISAVESGKLKRFNQIVKNIETGRSSKERYLISPDGTKRNAISESSLELFQFLARMDEQKIRYGSDSFSRHVRAELNRLLKQKSFQNLSARSVAVALTGAGVPTLSQHNVGGRSDGRTLMANPGLRHWTDNDVAQMLVGSGVADRISTIEAAVNINGVGLTDDERRQVFDRVVAYYIETENAQHVGDQYARDVAAPGVLLIRGLGATATERLGNLIRQWFILGLRDRNRNLTREAIRQLLEGQGVEDAYIVALFALIGREPLANRQQLANHLNVDLQDLVNRNAGTPDVLNQLLRIGVATLHWRVRGSGRPFRDEL